MPRPKGSGNPEAIAPYKWRAKGNEPLTEQYQTRLTKSMARKLDALSNKHDFVRAAIAVALESLESAECDNPTDVGKLLAG